MKPNADQLQFIHSGVNPRTNPANYEYETPPEELKPEAPVIILSPDAVYLVESDHKVGEGQPQASEAKQERVPLASRFRR